MATAAPSQLPFLREVHRFQAPYSDVDNINNAGLAHDGQHLYVMSQEVPDGVVRKITEVGTEVASYPMNLKRAYSIVWDGLGFWCGNHNAGRLLRFNRSFMQTAAALPFADQNFLFSRDTTWDGSLVWMGVQTKSGVNKMVGLNPAGDIVREFPSPSGNLDDAIVYDPRDDSFWISGINTRKLYHCDRNGTVVQTFGGEPFDSSRFVAAGLAISPTSGNLWVSANGNPDYFFEFDITPGPLFLENPKVSPVNGPAGTRFTWEVTANHTSGGPITQAQVFINGQPQDLTEDPQQPGRWLFSSDQVSLSSWNEYHFLVSDGNETVVSPFEGAHFGPLVGAKAYYDFESGEQGWLAITDRGCAGSWEHGASTQFTATNAKGLPGESLWATGLDRDYDDNAGSILVSPTHRAETNESVFFWMNYNSEQAFDAMNIHVSKDGGPFAPDGNVIIAPRPNTNLIDTGNCLVGGENGFSGQRVLGWNLYKVNLTYVADRNVALAFRFGSDGSQALPGFEIDDVAFLPVVTTPIQTWTPTPSPTRTPPPTFTPIGETPTPTPTPSPTPTATPQPSSLGTILAGYMFTNLSTSNGGTILMLAYAPGSDLPPTAKAYLSVDGLATDTEVFSIDPTYTTWGFGPLPVETGLSPGVFTSLGIAIMDGGEVLGTWPDLTVR